MRVLVADKDPYELDAFRAALEAPDLEVLTARDGEQTVEVALQELPDVLVLAASLGQMGGFAVCRDLKTLAGQGAIPEPKIIVLIEREADAWIAGWSLCDAWRTKPVEPADVDRLVRELAAPPHEAPPAEPARL